MALVEPPARLAQPSYDLEAIRAQFPIASEWAYFNHAGISPLAEPVHRAQMDMLAAIRDNGSAFFETDYYESLHAELVGRIGSLVNATPDEIALVQNTGTGLSIVSGGLTLQSGANIIVCDMEFPTNVYPWMGLARRSDAELRIVPPDNGGLTLRRLEEHADSSTALVAVSSVEFLTGHRTDLRALGDYCRSHDILFVVDGIQSLGHVPMDVRAMQIDFLSTGGMKSLLGPPGIGFLYIRRDRLEELSPVLLGGMSVTDYLEWTNYHWELRPEAGRYEMGTPNVVGEAGLNAALGMLLDLGIANIDAWVTQLADALMDDLDARGYEILTPRDPARHAHIVTWKVDDPQASFDLLNARKIKTAAREGFLRASLHCYNSFDEVLRIGEALSGS
ncbi:MAG: aminotransferase class V-fold PLP-dependent enzyme [Anaerolineales bacterium]